MKRGPKPQPSALKKAQGSFQPCRDTGLIEVAVASGLPQRPEWLSPEGVEVWDEDIERATRNQLVAECDSTLFALYCDLVGSIIKDRRADERPPNSAYAEARKMAEQFGLFGRKSRLVPDAGSAASNPFARNGSKAR